MDEETTGLLALHAGRAAHTLAPYMDEHERQELAPFLDVLEHTVVEVNTRHGDAELGVSARVTGLPKVGGLVATLLAQQQGAAVAHGGQEGVLVPRAGGARQRGSGDKGESYF